MWVQKQHEGFESEIGIVLSTNSKINVRKNCNMSKLAAVHTHLYLKFNIHVFKIGWQNKWGYWGLLTLIVIAIACFKFPFVLNITKPKVQVLLKWLSGIQQFSLGLQSVALPLQLQTRITCLKSPWIMVNWVLQPTSKSSSLETSSQVEALKFPVHCV